MEELIILILDDDNNRHKKFKSNILNLKEKINKPILSVHVFSAQECIDALKGRTFSYIFLDHDLEGKIFVDTEEKNTGSEVARWLRDNPDNSNNDAVIFLHSLNENGVAYMNNILTKAIKTPFAWEELFFESITW